MSADRDRILEQALKHELRAAGTPPAVGCLDAETLGAWADGGLDAAGIAAAEAHVSNCARCQALVGAFSRSNIAPETKLATPGLAWWKWGLAPIAAAVAASTLWMVIPEQQQIAVAPPQAKESAACGSGECRHGDDGREGHASLLQNKRSSPPASRGGTTRPHGLRARIFGIVGERLRIVVPFATEGKDTIRD